MDPCRYGSSCWRPLCPCVHVDGQSYGHGSRQRKKRTRSIVDVPGPQIEADDLPVPQVMKENFEEFKLPQERVVELAESPGEAQSSWSRASATTAAAAVATKVAKSVCEGEARPCGMQSTGPRQSLMLKSLVELGRLGPEHVARPAPTLQQSQGLLVKLNLLNSRSTVPRQIPNPISQSVF